MRLYNSLTRQVEEVQPVDGRTVKMYSCGPTVYRYAHLGNMRTFMLGDLIKRVLQFEGQPVYWVMNITDVGHMVDEASPDAVDKMQLAVEDEGLSPAEIARKYEQAFHEDRRALGILDADVYPRATEHIPEMLELIRRLIDRGHAYVHDGTVYFDVRSFPDYGKLSGNTLDKLVPGHRDLEIAPGKRHHADFSLWKKAGPGRLMKWDSPWGEGFPGWHIECSAMSMKYLGERFDVHTGGNDLKFPHHEDEIAQSEGATGHRVVSIWVHGGFLQMGGRKMAKSAQNIQRVTDLSAQGIDPLAFRLLCFGTRYRSEMDFSWDALVGANERLSRLRKRVADWAAEPAPDALSEDARALDKRFRDAVGDDLDLPEALKVLEEAVSSSTLPGGEKHRLLTSWDAVLGLDLERAAREAWKPTPEVEELVRRRDEARRARDFARADDIRNRLIDMGLEVMDTAEGTRVRPRRA
ncbi:MAG TPA: cysteine--tRNA ligase [Actinomycetota bacterium]|nr:cysteine--tRNA ligase [Actinomycetota bacterium]